MIDQHVDRPEVYAWQHVQPTGTNRPRAWIDNDVRARYGVLERAGCRVCGAAHLTGFGGHSGGVTPVPIPNTEVKPTSADGTWEETPRESRTPPDFSFRRTPLHQQWLRVGPSVVLAEVPVGILDPATAADRLVSGVRGPTDHRGPTFRPDVTTIGPLPMRFGTRVHR